jgi:hypothetical protein
MLLVAVAIQLLLFGLAQAGVIDFAAVHCRARRRGPHPEGLRWAARSRVGGGRCPWH